MLSIHSVPMLSNHTTHALTCNEITQEGGREKEKVCGREGGRERESYQSMYCYLYGTLYYYNLMTCSSIYPKP